MKTIFDTDTLENLVYVALIDGAAICMSRVFLSEEDNVLFVTADYINARIFAAAFNQD